MLKVNHLGGFGGKRRSASSGLAWPNGVLALRMDDTALSDEFGHTVTKTAYVNRSATKSKWGGYSAYFEGTAASLTISDADLIFLEADLTIAMWAFVPSTSINGGFVTFGGTGYGGEDIAVYNGTLYLNSLTLGITCPQNQWFHMAIVRSSGTTKLYINGTGYSISIAGNLAGSDIIVGSYFSSTYGLTGYIDDFCVSNGSAVWTSDFTPPVAPH